SRWWESVGKHTFPDSSRIYINCDCGGSNGCRVRMWKYQLRSLLAALRISIVYCDGNVAYETRIVESIVNVGKRNTQRIERKYLSLRTWCSRLVRCGIRFSKSCLMHRVVVGLVINFWFF
ncbi:MAG: hypothetical protein LBC12_07980, partial [Nitrososphaerota archaeon]|nr:hypothetical protein [Nitrososphaerota archaeon]